MIPDNDTGMFLLDIGISLFFRCHGIDNNRFFTRPNFLVIPDHDTRVGIDHFVIIPDDGQALIPFHIGIVAFNFVSLANHKVGHILRPFFLFPRNRTGISIGNLIAVPDNGLALAVFNGILGANHGHVFGLGYGIFVAINHVKLTNSPRCTFQRIVHTNNLRKLGPIRCISSADGKGGTAAIRIFYCCHQ